MKNRASLLLMEQLVMILVFALAAAVCLRGFAYAAKTSQEICRQEAAVFLAQTAAEELKREGFTDKGSCFYDDQMNPADRDENWCYRLDIEKLPQTLPGLGQAEVRVTDADALCLAVLTVGWQEG